MYIPRFAYKITSGYHEELDVAGTIEVVFLNGDNTLKTTTDSEGNTVSESELIYAADVTSTESGTEKNATTNYIIHPAFEAFDTDTERCEGLWVAKYEMSMETLNSETNEWEATESTTDNSDSVVDISKIRMTAKAGVNSWRNIQVTNIFENCYNMNRTLDSHMIKNTEWGAVAYLTVSQYGKGASNEVDFNESSSYLTGYGEDSTLSTGGASTTGNMYGVFDMSGGAIEYVAGYLEDECMESGGENYSTNEQLILANARYKDVYSIQTNEDGTTSNAIADCYNANSLKVGEGLWEVSDTSLAWYGDVSDFAGLTWKGAHNSVFARGGEWVSIKTSSGVFCSTGYPGIASSSFGFRTVCVVL